MMADDETPQTPEAQDEQSGAEQAEAHDQTAPSEEAVEELAEELAVEELAAEVVEEVIEEAAEEVAAEAAEELVEEVAAEVAEELVEEALVGAVEQAEEDEEEDEPAPRVKPSVPGAHLEVDIVPEGVDPLGRNQESYGSQYTEDPYAVEDDTDQGEERAEDEQAQELTEPISTAAIDLASGARYRATGKRKTAIARVTLRPGTGTYLINGRTLDEHFPRVTLQRNIRQPLETVGYQDRMDVVARLHGGGISAQAGALRHGVSRALLEADPNLRGELKRRGFLTRDSRAKERKKAGLKKARKRPQFSKR